MNKIQLVLAIIIVFFVGSCDDNNDAIYKTNKLILEASVYSEMDMNFKIFSWNDLASPLDLMYILVRSEEKQDADIYEQIVHDYSNEFFFGDQYWNQECYVRIIYYNENEYAIYASGTYYYKLIAFNENGYMVMSNYVYI